MKLKYYTKSIPDMEFIDAIIKYYMIKGDIINTFGENGSWDTYCIILYNVNHINYDINNNMLRIEINNIHIDVKLDVIDQIITEVE